MAQIKKLPLLDLLKRWINLKIASWKLLFPIFKQWISCQLLNNNCRPFKYQSYKMVKHTQIIRRLLPTNCLRVFDHFVGSAVKGISDIILIVWVVWVTIEVSMTFSFNFTTMNGSSWVMMIWHCLNYKNPKICN